MRRFRSDFGYIWRHWINRPATGGIGMLVAICLTFMVIYINPTPSPTEDAFDFYFMVHAEHFSYNPLKSNATADLFVTEVETNAETPDTSLEDETKFFLTVHLGD